MTPEQLALLEGLERQLAHLRRVRERLSTTDRIAPGRPVEWRGQAHRAYERSIAALAEALDRCDSALQSAITATSTALGTLRRG